MPKQKLLFESKMNIWFNPKSSGRDISSSARNNSATTKANTHFLNTERKSDRTLFDFQ